MYYMGTKMVHNDSRKLNSLQIFSAEVELCG